MAVCVDRFLAIHLHLGYQELVTHKRVVAVVSSIWLISVFLPTLTMLWVPFDISSFIILCLGVIGRLTTVVYIRIYLAGRRHKNQIQAQQVQHVAEDGELANFARLIKVALNSFQHLYFDGSL